MEKDAREAAGKYLTARAKLEAAAYGALADAEAAGKTWTTWSYDSSKPEELLAYVVSGSVSDAAEKKAALQALSAFLGSHPDLEASRDALYAFIADYDGDAGTKDFLRGFAGGRTEFYSRLGSEGSVVIDLSGGLLVEAARERERALRLPAVIDNYGSQSLAFAAASEAEGAAELRSALSSSGLLASGLGFSFVEPSVAWDLASSMSPAARETWLVSVLNSARQAETRLAGYQAERLEAWLADLEDYFAARENYEGAVAAGSSQNMQTRLAEVKSDLISLVGLEQGSLSMDKRLQSLANLYAWAGIPRRPPPPSSPRRKTASSRPEPSRRSRAPSPRAPTPRPRSRPTRPGTGPSLPSSAKPPRRSPIFGRGSSPGPKSCSR